MTQVIGLFCANPDCAEHTVDVTLRRALGRWWADTDHCPACGGLLSEQPSEEKLDVRRLTPPLRFPEAVADAQPRDRRRGVSG